MIAECEFQKIQENLKKAQQFIDQKDFYSGIQQLSFFQDQPVAKIHYLISLCKFNLKIYESAFDELQKAFMQSHKPILLIFHMFHLSLKLHLILAKPIESLLSQIKETIQQNNLDLSFFQDYKNISLAGPGLPSAIQQLDDFTILNDLEEHYQLLGTVGFSIYVVDIQWYQNWQAYINNEGEFPGPILQTEIISTRKLILDTDSVKRYTNIRLKKGKVENEDFVLVSGIMWNYIFNIYGGFELQRFSIMGPNEQVEQELYLMTFFILYDLEEFCIQISKQEFVQDLVNKIKRIFNKNEVRLFGIQNHQKNHDQEITFQHILQMNTQIQDLKLCKLDRILVDYKQENNWKYKVTLKETEFCQFCQKLSKSLIVCSCNKVKYCNSDCKTNDLPQHRVMCKKMQQQKQIQNNFSISPPKDFAIRGAGITGLSQLGNTCFMNSILQCLSNIEPLTYHFINNLFVCDINSTNPLSSQGKLAIVYSDLLKQMWCSDEKYISPWDLKKVISTKAQQYAGYNQQDAMEFFQYFIDILHEDLNKILKKPFIEQKDYDGREIKIVAKESWDNFKKRNDSFIVDYFSGQYKSSLKCPNCSNFQIVFDPFFNIQLPISQVQEKKQIYLVKLNTLPQLMEIPWDSSLNIQKWLQKYFNSDKQYEILGLNNKFQLQYKIQKQQKLEDLEKCSFKFIYEVEIKKVQMIINIQEQQNLQKNISYPRFIFFDHQLNNNELYFLAYQKIRFNLSFIKTFEIDHTITDITLIQQEFDQLYPCPFKLYYKDKNICKNNFFFDFEPENLQIMMVLDFNDNQLKSMKLTTCDKVSPKFQSSNENLSLQDCLKLFQKGEILDKDNEWYCNKCKNHVQAKKQLEIYKSPKILVLHLKRFKMTKDERIGRHVFIGGQKLETYVDFQVNSMNLSDYVIEQNNEIYDLVSISNHYGSLYGGHYTTYAKNFLDKKWLIFKQRYEFNDHSVREIEPSDLVTSAAYILFYQKQNI